MARHANENWNLIEGRLHTDGVNRVPHETVTHALLMDLRDRLDRILIVLECSNARAIPGILRSINANTMRKPRAKKMQ